MHDVVTAKEECLQPNVQKVPQQKTWNQSRGIGGASLASNRKKKGLVLRRLLADLLPFMDDNDKNRTYKRLNVTRARKKI